MSSLSVKVDEILGQSHVERLRDAGYDPDRVHDQGLSGASDETVWQRVCEERRFFITLDLDFSDVRRFPPGTHPGILLLRPRTASHNTVMEVLDRVLRERSLDLLRGCLTVASESYTRIRRPSTSD